jgi:motility quorum-sensing regulator / GCU-specific mRNA interferase toxin
MMGGKPTYDLQLLQQLVGQGPLSRIVTEAARAGAVQLLWEVSDIIAAVLELGSGDFYKSMESLKCPGLWQDVYHLEFRGVELYIKLQLSPDGRATVIQFKQR